MNSRAARAVGTFVHFFDVACKTTMRDPSLGSLRSYDGCANNTSHSFGIVFCDYSMLDTHEIGIIYFRLLGTNGFHVKADK